MNALDAIRGGLIAVLPGLPGRAAAHHRRDDRDGTLRPGGGAAGIRAQGLDGAMVMDELFPLGDAG